MEDDLTLGGGHTMQHTDHVPKKCTLDSYSILSTDATSIHIWWAFCIPGFPSAESANGRWKLFSISGWEPGDANLRVQIHTSEGQFMSGLDVALWGRSLPQPGVAQRSVAPHFQMFLFRIDLGIAPEKEIGPPEKVGLFPQFSTPTLRKPSLYICFPWDLPQSQWRKNRSVLPWMTG